MRILPKSQQLQTSARLFDTMLERIAQGVEDIFPHFLGSQDSLGLVVLEEPEKQLT